MRDPVAFPDAEVSVKDLLKALVADYEPDVTVAVGVPGDWTTDSPTHLQVAWDGTPLLVRGIVAHATVRIVARAHKPTEAKRVAGVAEGLLHAHTGGSGVAAIRPLTGVLPGRDPETHAELASFTVRATVRAEPLEPSGS